MAQTVARQLLSSGNGREHMALFMDQAALARGGRKQFRDRSKQAIMTIGHDQIESSLPRACAHPGKRLSHPSFDTFLPEALAKYTFRFFGLLLVIGLILLALRRIRLEESMRP